MVKREAKLQEKFGRWLKAIYLEQYAGGAFELKQTQGDSLPFSAVKDHQEAALLAVKHGKFYYKIPDDSMGAKPCDCVAMSGLDSYIVIGYEGLGVVMIDIDKWLNEKKTSVRRSLTFSRAKAIGEVIF
jgi:hypothetical protein